jgi:hypothetical protein
MSDTQNIIKEQFKTLPPVIQDTILNSNWQEKIRRVVKNNNLHVDQGAAIENLVIITMLGIETPDRFVKNAKEYAQISDDQALTISSEVEREIFSDIRKKLIAITETADTVADIDREANSQLNKVAQDIENAVKVNTKPSLKNKIPADYFEKNESTKPDPYKEPIPVIEKKVSPEIIIETPVVVKEEIPDVTIIPEVPETDVLKMVPEEPKIIMPKVPKPLFVPMPKSVEALKAVEPAPNTTQPAKADPYRETIG